MGRFVVSLHQPGVHINNKAVIYTLYDIGSDSSDFLLNAALKLEINKAGTFEFDILPSHSCYSILRRYIHYISVKEYGTGVSSGSSSGGDIEIPSDTTLSEGSPEIVDNGDTQIVFYGRILSMSLSFNGTKHVVCEGLMANLLDCPMYSSGIYHDGITPDKIFTISGTPATMFLAAINAYRNLIRTDIIAGNVNSEADDYEFEDIDVSGGTSVGDFITSELVEAHGGFLRMDYLELDTGDLYGHLNWDPDPSMSSYNESTLEQEIEFGVNLLDMSADNEDDEIATGIVPMWEDSENNKKWVTVSGQDVDAVSATSIYKPYVSGASGGLNAVGIKVVDIPGAKTQEKAISYSSNYVSKYCDYSLSTTPFDSYTVRAVDMHYLDPSKSRIWLYNRVRIKCDAPFSVNTVLLCTTIEILLDSPENSSYTFSVFRPKASSNDKTLARQVRLRRKKL